MKKSPFLFLCALALNCANLHAQDGTNTAGGEATGDGGNASYTIGQVDYLVNDGDNTTTSRYSSGGKHSASQGVQQPCSDSRVYGDLSDVKYSVFPNPASHFLIISATDPYIENTGYELLDAAGRLMMQGALTIKETKLKLSELKEGAYLVRILQDNVEIKNFKIVIAK